MMGWLLSPRSGVRCLTILLWIGMAWLARGQNDNRVAGAAPTSLERQQNAVKRQQEAVRREQGGGSGAFFTFAWPQAEGAQAVASSAAAPSPSDCDPLPEDKVTALVDAAAKKHQVEAKLVRSVIAQESAFKPCAVSTKGAQGLMQLMPATASYLKVNDVFDPAENVEAGVRYLKELLDKYKGDVKLALAAYNAGEGRVDRAGGVPDLPETKGYVDAITKKTEIQ